MRTVIQLEELGMFILSIAGFSMLSFQWWWFPVLLLAPDISFLGYAGGNKTGAVVYNVFHHKGIAVLIYLAGAYYQNEALQLTGVLLFGHASMDRFFGYGLKTFEGFKSTHLGTIGKR
jgi:hypothetical protein